MIGTRFLPRFGTPALNVATVSFGGPGEHGPRCPEKACVGNTVVVGAGVDVEAVTVVGVDCFPPPLEQPATSSAAPTTHAGQPVGPGVLLPVGASVSVTVVWGGTRALAFGFWPVTMVPRQQRAPV